MNKELLYNQIYEKTKDCGRTQFVRSLMDKERKNLGIDEWLELVKEDKNLRGAYICFGQYMYLLEQENQQLKENNLAMQEEMARTWAKLDKKEDIINKVKEYVNENTIGYKFGEEYYIDEFDRFTKPSKMLEILDNKGE